MSRTGGKDGYGTHASRVLVLLKEHARGVRTKKKRAATKTPLALLRFDRVRSLDLHEHDQQRKQHE